MLYFSYYNDDNLNTDTIIKEQEAKTGITGSGLQWEREEGEKVNKRRRRRRQRLMNSLVFI